MALKPSRTKFLLIATLAAAGLAVSTSQSHAQRNQSAESQPTIAAVTGSNVYVRSGAGDSFYPFGRLDRGALVEVTGEKFNWARIATRGPSFTPGTGEGQFFGYVIYPSNESGRFRVSSDGKSGTTLGPMDVLAPNLNTSFNPNDSWKPLIRLAADTKVTILATSTTTNNTVHRIALPENAEAWISKQFLRDATAEEIEQWKRPRAAEKKDEPAKKKEESPAAQNKEPVKEQRAAEPPRPTESRADEVKREEPVKKTEAERAKPQAGSDDEHTTQAVEGETEAAEDEPTLAEKVAKTTVEDLEAMLERLRRQPKEISEVKHLRQMYLDLAERERDRQAIRFAFGRADQLELWIEIRERQAELEQLRTRAQMAGERTEAARLAVYAHAEYDAIGRLTASTIYDGERLPRMLRLQEPGTARTLAYVQPEAEGFELIEMIGQWVGIVGEKEYDAALRLNILTPKRIDLLTPQQ